MMQLFHDTVNRKQACGCNASQSNRPLPEKATVHKLPVHRHFRLRENAGGQSVAVAMMPMPVFAARVRLAVIAAWVVGLRPGGVAIDWRGAIIGPVAVAGGGATAEDWGNEQHTQASRQLFHTGDSYRWIDGAS